MAFAVVTTTLITETTILPLQLVNGQNASASNSTNSKGAAAKTTITTTGNKTILVTNALLKSIPLLTIEQDSIICMFSLLTERLFQ